LTNIYIVFRKLSGLTAMGIHRLQFPGLFIGKLVALSSTRQIKHRMS